MFHAGLPLQRVLLLAATAGVLSCGRTGLGWDDLEDLDDPPGTFDAGPDAAPDGVTPSPTTTTPTPCVPTTEVCNGVDDDCNGKIDEVAPIACPGGGFRYCVAGRFSDCPTRCEVCVPGSTRACFLSYCKFWGVQTCTSDGKSFGFCREAEPPAKCKAIADGTKYTAELEKCCVDNGYCCRDDFDLDGDGDKGEMLGRCDDVVCK